MERRRRFTATEALKHILDEESDSSANDWCEDSSEDEYLPPGAVSESEDELDNIVDTTNSDTEVRSVDEDSDGAIHVGSEEGAFLVGRNGMAWDKQSPANVGRRRVQDIVKQAMGIKNCGEVTNAAKAFGLFVSEEIVMVIVRYTNKFARSTYDVWNAENPSNRKQWSETDDTECKSFIGLLLLAGIYRSNHECLDELWCEEAGRPVFRATMTLKRFKQLLRFCRFDDKGTREQRKENDKLAPIRDVWEMFQATLSKYYKASANVTVDEQLVPFRGRCPFRQYMQSKPAKYGMKIWWSCDAETSFPLCGQVYLGKEADAPREVNQGTRVVKDLIRPLYNTGRNVTMDNFFTSIPLAEELLQYNLTIVGTLRNNKPHLPIAMKPSNQRTVESSLFGFSGEMTLVSYVPKRSKAVNILSTFHHDESVPLDDNPRKKPEIILFYNKTKGGVDNLDKMVCTYTCRRRVLRWPMTLFFNLLDVAGVAAMIVWLIKYPEWKAGCKSRRRAFLREVGMQLTRPQIEKRLGNPRALQKGVRSGLKLLGFDLADELTRRSEEVEPRAKRRCVICPRSLDRKTRNTCHLCGHPVCKQHAQQNVICAECKND